MAVRTDRRVRKTKAALRHGLAVLTKKKSIKLAVHLTENPVAFQGKCGYNVMGAEKNKRRESGICFFQAH